MILYVTYVKSGVKMKGAIKEAQYELLSKDKNVSDLQIHQNQRIMETVFGGKVSSKRILLG